MEPMYRGLSAFPSTCLDTVRNISLKAFTVADFGIKNETEMSSTVYEDDETPEARDLIAGCVGSPSRQGVWHAPGRRMRQDEEVFGSYR